jgi:hypothetical protein
VKEALQERPFTGAEGTVITATTMRRVDAGMR